MSSTIDQAQQAIVEAFGFFGDWSERYRYLIELGRSLPVLTPDEMSEENRLHGCQAQVWLVADYRDGLLHFRANSDAAIVAGLIGLLLKVYSGRTPREILDSPPAFLETIGLSEHLSPYRANGLALMVKRIQGLAQAHL